MSSHHRLAGLAISLAILMPSMVHAQTTPAPSAPFAASAIDDKSLGAIAGREDSGQIATNSQNAAVTRNSVGDNVRTGDAKISDNAFQNMSGLSILNVNTGNNVAINAAMSVNVAISPGK